MENNETKKEVKLLKVKSSTNSKLLASSIVSCFTDGAKTLKLRGIGAGAVTQMVYGVIIAEGRLKQKDVKMNYRHYYKDVVNHNFEATKKSDPTISAIEYELTFD